MNDIRAVVQMYTKGLMVPMRMRPHRFHWLWGMEGHMISGRILTMGSRLACPAENDDPKPPEVTI